MLSLLIIMFQRNKVAALAIFLLSGFLGFITFRLPVHDPFYPLFTGLFALPLLIEAYLNPPSEVKIEDSELRISKLRIIKFSALGTFFGALASLLPTLTAGQSSLLGSKFTENDEDFLTIVYSTNTAAYSFSLVNLALTGRARNGVMVAIGDVSLNELPYLYLLALSAGMIVLSLAPKLALLMGKLAFKRYRLSIILILSFLFILGYVYNGIIGVTLMLSAMFLGFLAPMWGVARVTYMGVLMVPILVETII